MATNEVNSFKKKVELTSEHENDGQIKQKPVTRMKRDFQRKLTFMCQTNPIEEHTSRKTLFNLIQTKKAVS